MPDIPLSRGLVAVVDAADYPRLAAFSWSADRHGYAVRWDRHLKKPIPLHRYLMNFPEGVVDHIDGDPLNNRRANLRVVVHEENCANRTKPNRSNLSSGFVGVARLRRQGKQWRAHLMVRGKNINLGNHRTLMEAVEARVSGERAHRGEVCAFYRNLGYA